MTDRTEPKPPAELLRAVAGDLHAVRPLPSPGRRVLALVPLGILLVVAIPEISSWRYNLDLLGDAGTWGLSALQALAGFVLIGAALREAVPGRELSRAALATTAIAALALFAAITVVSSWLAPTTIRPGAFLRWAWECFEIAVISAVPALAAVGWLAARALPTRPAVAGTIYGLGAGVLADAGTRLFCWVSNPSHVLISHGGAILAMAAFGAASATLIEAAKRRWRRRPPRT